MDLIIKSELSKKILLEEDAIKGFKKAVANNQLLLAMQVLTEILDAFMEAFDSMIEIPESKSVDPSFDLMIDIPESKSVDPEVEPASEDSKQKPKKDKNQNEKK